MQGAATHEYTVYTNFSLCLSLPFTILYKTVKIQTKSCDAFEL